MPKDLKRVLTARAAAARDGMTEDAATDVVMAAAHG
jgi:hypothetical protein